MNKLKNELRKKFDQEANYQQIQNIYLNKLEKDRSLIFKFIYAIPIILILIIGFFFWQNNLTENMEPFSEIDEAPLLIERIDINLEAQLNCEDDLVLNEITNELNIALLNNSLSQIVESCEIILIDQEISQVIITIKDVTQDVSLTIIFFTQIAPTQTIEEFTNNINNESNREFYYLEEISTYAHIIHEDHSIIALFIHDNIFYELYSRSLGLAEIIFLLDSMQQIEMP